VLLSVRRFKSHLRYETSKRKKRIFLIFLIFVVFLTTYIIFSGLDEEFSDIVSSAAESKISGTVSVIVNETINDYLRENAVDYSSLYVAGENGEAVSVNVSGINSVKSEISEIIQNKISDIGIMEIKIPLGNMLGSEFLMGRGPFVPFRFVTHGKVSSDFESAFSEAGINQTKHEVKIRIKVKISFVLPSGAKSTEVVTSVPLADSISIGNVPQFYMSKGE